MSDIKDLPKKLPPMETLINLDVQGTITGKKYSDTFKFLIPNGKLRAKADIKRAQLNTGIPEGMLDPYIAQYHYKLGYLYASIVESPEWWRKSDYGYDLHDVNVVDSLYEECLKFEQDWMNRVWGDQSKSDGERKQ